MLSKLPIVLELLLCYICLPANSQSGVIDEIVRQVSQKPGELLIASDYNGVLVEGKNSDTDSLISKIIRPVTETPGITLYVSSSESAEQLHDLLGGVYNLGLSAENNMDIRHPHSSFKHNTINRLHAQEVLNYIESSAKAEGYPRQPDKGERLKTHFYSRNLLYPKEKDNDLEGVRSWFDGMLKGTGFEAVIDSDPERRSIMVASQSRGKENLLIELLKGDKYKFAISLGDESADMKAMDIVKSKGFIGILVGKNVKGAAENAGLYHLEGPDDVHELFQKLVNLKKASTA